MVGRATLTTEPSTKARLEASMVAASTRPGREAAGADRWHGATAASQEPVTAAGSLLLVPMACSSMRLRQCAFEILRRPVYARRHIVDHLGHLRDLAFRLGPFLFIHIFANRGHGLGSVTRVGAWSIDLVLEPRPPRQTF